MNFLRTEKKTKITKTFLSILGIYLVGLGLGHIFFPEEGHRLIGQKMFDPNNPWMIIAATEMGVMFFVFGLISFVAARDPIKNKSSVLFVVLSSILTDLVRVWAILFKESCSGLWIFIAVSVFLWLAIIIFYPYKELKFGKCENYFHQE